MSANNPAETVLITGAAGFVGRHLIAHLLQGDVGSSLDGQEGAAAVPYEPFTGRIVACVLPNIPHEGGLPGETPEELIGEAGWTGASLPGRVEIVPVDICDAEAVKRLFEAYRPSRVVHLAARASGADSDRDAVFRVNVGGSRAILEAAASLTPFPRVLLVSTGYVYGNTDEHRPAREVDPVGPLWKFGAYTDSKIEMETAARGYRALAVTARAFSHTGPGQPPLFAVPSFARQIAAMERGEQEPVLRVGNLDAKRDILDVRDVVRAYRLIMDYGAIGETYNVATGHPHSMGEILDTLRSLSRVPTTIEIDPARLRPADIACSTGDTLRIRYELGWAPRYSLRETLQAVLDSWRRA